VSQYWIKITPVAKPRQTRSDVWKKRPAVVRYRAFADNLRAEAKRTGFEPSGDGMEMIFFLPMPKSWSESKRQKMWHKPHQQKPDLDNLVKSVLDALCADDCFVWQLKASKRWAHEGVLNILVSPDLTHDQPLPE
jgi:Holliday junction resolvase RusA-like endonuclease